MRYASISFGASCGSQISRILQDWIQFIKKILIGGGQFILSRLIPFRKRQKEQIYEMETQIDHFRSFADSVGQILGR